MDLTKYITAYREPYEKALAELAELIQRLEEIDIERDAVITRIDEVRDGIAAFAPLVKENPAETHPDLFPDESEVGADLGLTDAIRRVLGNANPKKLTPVGVRTGLTAIGFKTDSKNLLSSIHSVLKRLKKSSEVVSETGEDGRTWYKWNAPTYNVTVVPPPRRRPTNEQTTLDDVLNRFGTPRRKSPFRQAMEDANKKKD